MEKRIDLILVGASVRAAAYSARRAGFTPLCFDLFGDADLQARFPSKVLESTQYPKGFLPYLEKSPPVSWMYTGALENYPSLVRAIENQRKLLGVKHESLSLVRNPDCWTALLRKSGLPVAEVCRESLPAETNSWLRKPRNSGGGFNISIAESGLPGKGFYFQKFIPGSSVSVVYLGSGKDAVFLGATRQLVGEAFLNARTFAYCGSIGPIALPRPAQAQCDQIGQLLASEFRLTGLFGVDGILAGDDFFPVEINPRYTASVELLELATGIPFLKYHSQDCTEEKINAGEISPRRKLYAKAILFSPVDFRFPDKGPWRKELEENKEPWQLPNFADIPKQGSLIKKSHPILTFYTDGQSEEDCLSQLQKIALELKIQLFPDHPAF